METVKVFRSYRDAARRLEKAVSESVAYQYLMSILDYGLDGIEPDPDTIPGAMFVNVKPTMDLSIKKSESGAKGGSKSKANGSKLEASQKQTEANGSKQEAEVGSRIKEVGSRIKEVGDTPQKSPPGERFDRFWAIYPNKTGKQAALKAWSKLKPSEELTKVILDAVEYQKTWDRWTKDGGQYIPNPATWLNQGRWEDEPPDSAAHTEPTDGENFIMGINPDELEGIF